MKARAGKYSKKIQSISTQRNHKVSMLCIKYFINCKQML